MDLPINEQELNTILNAIRFQNTTLYKKLWLFKMNYMKRKEEENK